MVVASHAHDIPVQQSAEHYCSAITGAHNVVRILWNSSLPIIISRNLEAIEIT